MVQMSDSWKDQVSIFSGSRFETTLIQSKTLFLTCFLTSGLLQAFCINSYDQLILKYITKVFAFFNTYIQQAYLIFEMWRRKDFAKYWIMFIWTGLCF